MRSVLLATCAEFSDGDEDAAFLQPALHAFDVAPRWAVWDDPAVDWTGAPVILRSTWDYPLHRDRFLAWAAAVPVLHNPAGIVRWNSDKVYLHELIKAGVPTTPTAVMPPGEATEFSPDTEFVIKPSVGAGSLGVGRFGVGDVGAAAQHVRALHEAGLTALVQPYLAGVDEAGETALMYVAGRFSHAIRKGPMLPDGAVYDVDTTVGLFVPEHISSREPSAEEIAVGDRALAFVLERFGIVPLYARIDVLPAPAGPVVGELELVEPSLFLSHADGAPDRFASAIAAIA